MGLAQVLDIELAWYCEYEPPTQKHPRPANAAAKVMAHRFPGVPNHGDLTVVDWDQAESVDVIAAGFPCQPFSQAGRRKGQEDGRAIWPYIAAAIRAVRPRYVFLENVSAIAGAGELARACGDLAQVGYDTCWTCVRASDVRAPHRRERIFILAADATSQGWGQSERPPASDSAPAPQRAGQAEPGRRHRTVADTSSFGWGEGRPQPTGIIGGPDAPIGGDAAACEHCGHPDWHHDADGFCTDCPNGCYDGRPDAASDTDGDGCERRQEQDSEPVEPGLEASLRADVDGRVLDWAGYRPAIERWEQALGRRAPAPTVLGKRGGRQLNPVFVEFLMGLPEGWVTAVPGLTRNQMLKCLGNGVVPAQAAAAFRHLWPLLTEQAVAA